MTKQSIVDFILDQLSDIKSLRSRKMFGEHAIYCDDKVCALVCDDQLFIKKTDAGKALIGDTNEQPAYPGAKPSYLIDAERWEDREWLTQLFEITAKELPKPKIKKTKK
jgi:TfoX/Sxy family transcriptional regulator of competence genes